MNNIEQKMFENYPDVVTISDMCQMIGIGRNKAYELINENTIQCVRIGRRFYIPKIRIIEFLMK